MKTVNLGGDRLGSGKKMNVTMHGYERSNHDLSYLFKTTMSPGTLVPFMVKVALPGDTWDIDLNALIKTNPTLGPLFGSFKVQLDVFNCPMRLYHSALHNNRLDIGMNMSQIKLPHMQIVGPELDASLSVPVELQQINQSSLLAYLGIRGLGAKDTTNNYIARKFNAIPLFAYWDIFKNYYANKQENNAYYIECTLPSISSTLVNGLNLVTPYTITDTNITLTVTGINVNPDNCNLTITGQGTPTFRDIALNDSVITQINEFMFTVQGLKPYYLGKIITAINVITDDWTNTIPQLVSFPLSNIDDMRQDILSNGWNLEFQIDGSTYKPYGPPLSTIDGNHHIKAILPQVGLAVKTYQSDLFNNWIQTDWIEGTGSIADITKISTAGNVLYLDALNLAKKVYDMLNRIAVSGGTYQDWLEASYDHDSKWRAESPIYCGGLSKELVFQEVVSNAATNNEPLGSLAGKGIMTDKHKGGNIIINIDEPAYIIGLISLTPRISYSQGNDWHTYALNTIDDLHKPALDQIGFQDLITDQLATFDTDLSNFYTPVYSSAGKQPAWLNYMTDYDRNYGNFADPRNQMFMTLDRRYEADSSGTAITGIKDLTTYINPSKFNYAFAQTSLDAMNFWTQISINASLRRKISAKLIPNL